MSFYCKCFLLLFLFYGPASLADESSSEKSAAIASDTTKVSSSTSDSAAKPLDAIPYKKDSDIATSSIINLTVFILILIGLFVFLLKNKDKLSKMGLLPLEQGKRIAILDRQKLHADNVVYLITVDDKRYLLAVGSASTTVTPIE